MWLYHKPFFIAEESYRCESYIIENSVAGFWGSVSLPAMQPLPCLPWSCVDREAHGGRVYQYIWSKGYTIQLSCFTLVAFEPSSRKGAYFNGVSLFANYSVIFCLVCGLAVMFRDNHLRLFMDYIRMSYNTLVADIACLCHWIMIAIGSVSHGMSVST